MKDRRLFRRGFAGLRNAYRASRGKSLLANSLNLMLASGLSAIFGFVFWVIIARSFVPNTVGIATTLLSTSSLVSLLSQVGFDTVLVRFLPKSKNRNNHINTGLILSGVASIILATAFCLLSPLVAPDFVFLIHNPLYILLFDFFTLITTWTAVTNSIFIAYRNSSYILYVSVAFSLFKVVLPFIFIHGGAMTIFVIVGAAQVFNVVLCLWALIKKFDYRPQLRINRAVVKEVRRFGAMTYLSNIFNLASDFLLPIIVLNKLGAASAAYFYIAFTIANLLYTIAFSISKALLAEASHNEEFIGALVRKNIKIMVGLMLPAIVGLLILGPWIMKLFGKTYGDGISLLAILSASGLIVAAYSTLGVIFKIRKNLKRMILMSLINGVAILGLSMPFADAYGLVGIGYAWLLGNVISVAAGCVFLYSWKSKNTPVAI